MKTDHAAILALRALPGAFTSVYASYVNLKNVEVLYTLIYVKEHVHYCF